MKPDQRIYTLALNQQAPHVAAQYVSIAWMLLGLVLPLQSQPMLRYAPVAGEQRTFEIQIDSRNSQSMRSASTNNEVTFSTKTTLNDTLLIQDVNKTAFTGLLKYGAARVEVRGMAQLGLPDTTLTLPETRKIRQRISFSPQGVVLKREVLNSDTLSEAVRQFLSAGGSNVETILSTIMPQLPKNKPATLGTSWTETLSETPTLAIGTVKTTKKLAYTVTGVLDTLGMNCLRVNVSSISFVMKFDIKSQSTDTSATAAMQGSGDGIIEGVLYLETGSRMLVASQMRSVVNSRVEVSGAQTMSITAKQDIATTARLSSRFVK